MVPSRPRPAALVPALGAALLASAMLVTALAPARSDASVRRRTLLAHDGVQVTAPLAPSGTTILRPGRTLVLRVATSADAREARGALVSVRRLSTTGGPAESVARRRVRNGTVRVRLDGPSPARYRVSARIGRRVRERTVRTGDAPPATPAPTPRPVPAPVPAPPCGTGVTISLGTPTRTTGPDAGRFPFSVPAVLTNAGTATLSFGAEYRWERAVDGAWAPVPSSDALAWPSIAFASRPGTSHDFGTMTTPDMGPGTYRVTKTVVCTSEEASSRNAVIASPPVELPAP